MTQPTKTKPFRKASALDKLNIKAQTADIDAAAIRMTVPFMIMIAVVQLNLSISEGRSLQASLIGGGIGLLVATPFVYVLVGWSLRAYRARLDAALGLQLTGAERAELYTWFATGDAPTSERPRSVIRPYLTFMETQLRSSGLKNRKSRLLFSGMFGLLAAMWTVFMLAGIYEPTAVNVVLVPLQAFMSILTYPAKSKRLLAIQRKLRFSSEKRIAALHQQLEVSRHDV